MEETLGLWREAYAGPPKTLCSLYPSMLCWDIGLVEKVRKSAQVGSAADLPLLGELHELFLEQQVMLSMSETLLLVFLMNSRSSDIAKYPNAPVVTGGSAAQA